MPRAWFDLLPREGELGGMIREHDWSATPLGPPESWPQPLRTLVSLIMDSHQPMFIAWGPERTLLYNDSYAPLLGAKHPGALGRDFAEVWREAWPELTGLFATVFAGGAVHNDDIELVLERGGAPEEAHFSFFYTPVRDERGGVAGLFCGCTETTEKVLIERRRAVETERLRALFDAAPSFVTVLHGPEHTVEFANAAYLQLIGYRDTVGQPIRAALPEVADQGFFELLDQVYATGEAFVGSETSVRLQRTAGGEPEERFVDFIYQPIRDEQGAVTGIFIEGSDVTERHRATEELHGSNARFRAAIDAVQGVLWTNDADGRMVGEQAGWSALTGQSRAEYEGYGWAAAIHPDDSLPTVRAWEEAVDERKTFVFEHRVRRHDGVWRRFSVRAAPVVGTVGEVIEWVGVHTDVTEQRAAETALRESEELNRRILDSSNDCITVLGLNGSLQYVSPGGLVSMEVDDVATIQGGDWRRVWPEPSRTLADNAMAEARAGGQGRFQGFCRTLKGSPKWWDVVVLPMLDAAGAPERIVTIGRDVTAEHESAKALQRLNDTLEAQVEERTRELMQAEEALRQAQKMEAVGQLTGGIAHDFNNLLQGILGSLNLVQKRIASGRTQDVDRFITGAVTSANRAAALTHRLLAFSRRQPLDPKPVRANALVASMEDLLRRTLGESIELELVLAGGLWPTLCDPNQLESALLNLAINARDAMPTGGRLTVETCNAHLDSAYTAKQREVTPGQYVCLCVTDTGSGMSPDVIERAFDPFFTTKAIGQGTGLGLSMIYGFARQSEGYAKIYSEVGRGTTVKLYLPRHRGEGSDGAAEDAAPVLTEAHQAEAGETVLVVEDEPVVRSLIVEVLAELGYSALEAADGPSGLELLRNKRRRIDLLVTDIGLPGLNGRQLADAGRELRPELRVLFMTGYAENAALANGFLDVGMAMITKPFAMEQLATRIREMIEG